MIVYVAIYRDSCGCIGGCIFINSQQCFFTTIKEYSINTSIYPGSPYSHDQPSTDAPASPSTPNSTPPFPQPSYKSLQTITHNHTLDKLDKCLMDILRSQRTRLLEEDPLIVGKLTSISWVYLLLCTLVNFIPDEKDNDIGISLFSD